MKHWALTADRRGFALGIVLALVACLGVWITSVSWSMMTNRSQYQRMLKSRKAYYLARAGMEHLLLKLKVMQRHRPQTVRAIEQATEDEKKALFSVFLEDIVIPPDEDYSGELSKYRITEFDVESVDLNNGTVTVRIGVTGSYEGYENSISRLMRISR